MTEVSINKSIRLSQHYTLREMTKTGTGIPNIPSRVNIENLRGNTVPGTVFPDSHR